MKLSERLHFYTQDPNPVHVDVNTIIEEIRNLENENDQLKSRLNGIQQKAFEMDVALLQMEETLHKLHTGG